MIHEGHVERPSSETAWCGLLPTGSARHLVTDLGPDLGTSAARGRIDQ